MSHLRFSVSLLLFLVLFAASILAQKASPDMSVAGLRLGDRDSGKAFLSEYQPRMSDGGAAYYFYNSRADTVMKVTATSADDRFFVTEIEVFAVDEKYRNRHFQLDKIARFITESGIFIGWHQSGRGIAATLIIGVPYPLGVNSIGQKEVTSRFGEPQERKKTRDDETLDYRLASIAVPNADGRSWGYTSHFEFHKHDLERFSIKLVNFVTP